MIDPAEQQLLVRQRILDSAGVVIRWPTKPSQRLLVLRHLSARFVSGRAYTEPEVNEILKRWHSFEDWSLLRRELVDRGYMRRDSAGREYRLANPPDPS